MQRVPVSLVVADECIIGVVAGPIVRRGDGLLEIGIGKRDDVPWPGPQRGEINPAREVCPQPAIRIGFYRQKKRSLLIKRTEPSPNCSSPTTASSPPANRNWWDQGGARLIRLIVVQLHLTAERPTSRIDPRGYIKQPGLLGVDLNERLLAVHDGGTPLRIDHGDVLIRVRVFRVADEYAGVVHPAFKNGSREIHGEVGGANRDSRECLVLSRRHNDLSGLSAEVPGLPSPAQVPPVTLAGSEPLIRTQ
jgi:hypothetical protein